MQSKTPQKIEAMITGGRKLASIRNALIEKVRVGVTPIDIDKYAKTLINKTGGEASFLKVPNYRWATCVCVNDCVVHGIPTNKPLQNGDVVCIDVGLLYEGFHTDTADTVVVGTATEGVTAFLDTGKNALNNGIMQAVVGNRIGHISRAIQETIESKRFSVVRTLVGHGIGQKLHEAPEVPGYLKKPIEQTPLLLPDMILAIEVIYTMGKPEVVTDSVDGWTVRTGDHSISAVFEHTVLVSQRPRVLTQ